MPRFDGTGPMGQGPKTGRALGYCNSDEANQVYSRRGMRRGARCFGRGFRGRGFCWYNTQTNYDFDEKDLFEKEKEVLEQRLKVLNKKLNELNAKEE